MGSPKVTPFQFLFDEQLHRLGNRYTDPAKLILLLRRIEAGAPG
jgi:hypothetical protein